MIAGLDDMYLFKSVVDCGGMSAAGRRLDVPKSTIARRLAELEERLGLQLFHRGARQFALTNFGAECYEHCVRMAEEAEKVIATAERLRQAPAGSIHVVCPPLLSELFVEQLATEFLATAPDVHLHLEATQGTFDPRTVNADLALYPAFAPLPDASLIARKVFSAPYELVASPHALENRAPLTNPQSLKTIPCLALGQRSTDWHWTLRRGREVERVRIGPRFTTTQLSALLRACRQGLGVAALPSYLCEEDVRTGRLVRVLGDWLPAPVEIFVTYPSGRALTAAARQFLDLLIARLPTLAVTGQQDGPQAQ